MTPTDNHGDVGGLVQRVEVLLSSLTAVASARVVFDEEEGTHVHIIATSELSVYEVSNAALSALTWGLGLALQPNQITVVQSRLSRDDLKSLLGPEAADPPPTGVAPTGVAPTGVATESPPTGPTDPKPSVPDTGLLEFSLGGNQGEAPDEPEPMLGRLELKDLQLERHPQGGFAISVRLANINHSITVERDAAGTEEDSLEVPASAALDVIQEFLRSGRTDGPRVGLKFLSARRLRHAQHDVVVVLVEAVVRGRQIPLTGAASANGGVERASILATLQATNAFVSGTLTASPTDDA
jgi:hypothetical protein